MRARPSGEDVENQGSAVDDQHAQLFLDVALLAWAQFVIEEYDRRTRRPPQLREFFQLALAEERARMWLVELLRQAGHRLHIGCFGELLQLVERVLDLPRTVRRIDTDQHRPFYRRSRGQGSVSTLLLPIQLRGHVIFSMESVHHRLALYSIRDVVHID